MCLYALKLNFARRKSFGAALANKDPERPPEEPLRSPNGPPPSKVNSPPAQPGSGSAHPKLRL
jgi:hypothetical protein